MRKAILALFAWVLLSAQSPMVPGFPPGTFQNRVALDASAATGVTCTGGVRSTSGGNTIITFTANDTLNCTGTVVARVLVVGGGGGGASGGAGAGGYCTTESTPTCGLSSTYTINSGSQSVTIGTGGAASPTCGVSNASDGAASIIQTITANGGAKGIGTNANGTNGGSGGGGGATSTINTTGGTGNQGSNGGDVTTTASPFPAAGGGGAGVVGQSISSGSTGGNGGAGISNSISGSAVFYAGGGGGGVFSAGTGGTGGTGGGGNGAAGSANPQAGTANTGGGAGGGGNGSTCDIGGSGIIIIACPTGNC